MTTCPYEKRPGYAARLARAKRMIETFGRDNALAPWRERTSRSFDNCFEMFDGEAIVWGLMQEAQTNEILAEGIRRMGKNVWPEWMAVYQQQPEPQQLPLFTA